MTEAVIGAQSEILMHFDLTLEDGSAADSTRVNNKPAKVFMGDASISDAFEAQLMGLKVGDKKKFTLVAADAFGESNPDNIYHLDRTKFGADMTVEEGSIIAFAQPDGSELPGVIRAAAGDSVTVDFNHPLAGQTVVFDVEIMQVK